MSDIAIIIPCYNEEKTIAKVIADFRKELPEARIVVVDNASSDATAKIAAAENALVLHEPRRGKGSALKNAFRNLDADIYIMTDGDDTYPAEEVHKLLKPIIAGEADMTVGTRLKDAEKESLKLLNNIGNRIIITLINLFFGTGLTDALSGYRILTEELAKNLPLFSRGFEIETELTLQTLEKGFRLKEIPIKYRARHKESPSKLKPFRDGYKIILTIGSIMRDSRPMLFFPAISLALLALSLIWGVPVVREYLEFKYVYRLPSAILSSALFILSLLFFIAGFIVHTIDKRFDEIYFMLRRKKK
ncbi:MAG: glycosyltransferase family 2 protein [Endomicrobiia bacterium]|nr:glycosyltransferase family 2 protein [Endomicrobiia bacterium]